MKASNLRSSIVAVCLMTGAMSLAAGAAGATIWQVPGDSSNVCTIGNPNCDTIQQAVSASTGGDTILLGAATFSGAGNVGILLDKSLTITGAGRASTTVQLDPGGFGFSIRADDVAISDLAITGGATGVNFQSVPSDNAQLSRIDFSSSTARGVDISTGAAQPISSVAIDDCTFTAVNTGVRMSSNSIVDGLTITNSTFDANAYGLYQANDGNQSTLTGLTIADCAFTNNTQFAIYAEEMRDAAIEDSTFTDNRVAIQLLKLYTSNGVAAANIAIERNQFSGHSFTTINLEVPNSGLEDGITVADNDIALDVGTLAFNAAGIFVGLGHAHTHAPVAISDNTITLAGTFGVASAAFGVRVRRNGPVLLTGNVLDGGGVGGSGNAPATSGLYVESNSAAGAMPAGATISASCNQITGFRNGVSVFDSAGAAYGGLAAGVAVTLEGNDIAGNADFGVLGGAGETVDAQGNWWGCAAGPGNPGCDAVGGAVDASAPSAIDEPCASQCPSAPQVCRAAAKSILVVKDKTDDSKDKLIWKWIKGASTTTLEFGDPTDDANYTLCIYAGSTAALAGQALVPANPSAWSPISTKGYKYKDKLGSADGITKAVLKGSDQNKSKALVKGKGSGLPDFTLPIEAPVVVQLRNSESGICWGASYLEAQLIKNQVGLLKGKAQ